MLSATTSIRASSGRTESASMSFSTPHAGHDSVVIAPTSRSGRPSRNQSPDRPDIQAAYGVEQQVILTLPCWRERTASADEQEPRQFHRIASLQGD